VLGVRLLFARVIIRMWCIARCRKVSGEYDCAYFHSFLLLMLPNHAPDCSEFKTFGAALIFAENQHIESGWLPNFYARLKNEEHASRTSALGHKQPFGSILAQCPLSGVKRTSHAQPGVPTSADDGVHRGAALGVRPLS
jgi:hypothetical protein